MFCVNGGGTGGRGDLVSETSQATTVIRGGNGASGGKCLIADISVKGASIIDVSVGSSGGDTNVWAVYENERASVSSGGAGGALYMYIGGGIIYNKSDAGNGKPGTRAFGDADGTLYAGGGGGGGAYDDSVTEHAAEGYGGVGGGNGGGFNGSPNTGGGGGGAYVRAVTGPYGVYPSHGNTGLGGSGVAIIRWG